MLDAFPGACYPSRVANRPQYETMTEREIATGRALAAVAYLPGLCFIGLLDAPNNRFVQFHARQGLALFIAEIIAVLAIAIVEGSLGRVPFLSIVAGMLLRLTLGLSFLGATVYGMLKGFSGDLVRIPFLGDLAERMER